MIKNYISVGITDYCNFRCYECPMGFHRVNDRAASIEALDIGKFEQILMDCFSPSDTVIEITGGEPTFSDVLDNLLKMLHSHKYPATILTNCTRIGDLPKYDNLKIIGSWYPHFMSLPYLKKQIGECKNDLYMTLYVNRDDRYEMQKVFDSLGVKQIAGSWNDNDAVLKSIGLDSTTFNKITFSDNIVGRCFCVQGKLLNVSRYDGSEKMQAVIKTANCDKCEKQSGYTCHIIYKTWQVMNNKKFEIDLSNYGHIKTFSLGRPENPLAVKVL
jgi:organic radical activating enzyme